MIGDALRELLGLPGARYSCVADPATGQVLSESGDGGGAVPAGLLAWGSGAARFLAEVDADELDDLIVTSRRNYHLVRRVGPGPTGRLLVYLRLDRARGNLAAARRELASPRVQERLTAGARSAARPALPGPSAAPAPADPVAPPPSLPGRRAGPLGALPRPAAGQRPGGASRSVPGPTPSAPAVPRQRGPVTALPRRSAAPPPQLPPRAPAGAGATVPDGLPEHGLTWANDSGTLRRLLAALRRMA